MLHRKASIQTLKSILNYRKQYILKGLNIFRALKIAVLGELHIYKMALLG
jgi:hypothetical protein